MIGVGVIGYGYWGPNLVRNFSEVTGSRVEAVCDFASERLAVAASSYPGVRTMTNPHELICDPKVDAVVIATPVGSHFELAWQALQAGKHVLVEKPMCTESEQAMRLVEEADRQGVVLMVDHTFVYSAAVRKIRDLVTDGHLGQLYYYDSVRVNLGLFQHDVNVLWDLAVHDLSIMDYVIGQRPQAVAATGTAHLSGQPEDVAYLTCFFDHDIIAHFHVNWLAPVKIRRTLIGGDQRMIVYDDLEPSEKIKVYDKGITVDESEPEGAHNLLVGYRSGDMWSPQVETTEALRTEVLHFLDCIEGSSRPLTCGRAGLEVVSILEAATSSMRQRGHPVALRP
jgi:predicted dehydrogenase